MKALPPKLPVAIVALTTLHLFSEPALAQSCEIPPAGEVLCDEVVIDGTQRVRAYDPASATPTGYLHIRAHTITITETGVIDATGSGYQTLYVGSEPTNGSGPGGGARGAPAFMGAPAPGGGGAHLGSGGLGMLDVSLCTASANAVGGAAYDDAMAPNALGDVLTAMGSAGAGSYCGDSGNQLRGGGRGGGVVILTAGKIDLRGRILANGQGRAELGPNLLGCGPGAGAGGSIVLDTYELSIGGAGLLAAVGGDSPRTRDAQNMDATNSWGGAGGGGLITVFAQTAPVLTADASGGSADCSEGFAGDGVAVLLPPNGCVDADADGFENAICGGTDCHDGVAEIHPDGVERCDGVDNDCDGAIDEDPETLCPAGSGTICVEGTCRPSETEGGGGGVPDQVPEAVLGGGLCAIGGKTDGAWLLACALALLWRRRRS